MVLSIFSSACRNCPDLTDVPCGDPTGIWCDACNDPWLCVGDTATEPFGVWQEVTEEDTGAATCKQQVKPASRGRSRDPPRAPL